jgi:hypothetical protein
LSDTVIAMLPSLSKLSIGGVCPSCTAPTDAELSRWDLREELEADEFERIPMSYRSSRTECAICYNELREPSPEDNKSMEVIVAVDSYGSCGHAFHQKCLQRWFDRQVSVAGTLTCPLCRQPFLDQKIDRLYDRIDGERPPPAPRPRGVAPLEARNPIPEYVTLWEDAMPDADSNGRLRWRVILSLSVTLESVRRLETGYHYVVHIPDGCRNDWMQYAYNQFRTHFTLDRARFTFEVWENIMIKSQRMQTWWLSYHVLVSKLRSGQIVRPGTMFAYILGL